MNMNDIEANICHHTCVEPVEISYGRLSKRGRISKNKSSSMHPRKKKKENDETKVETVSLSDQDLATHWEWEGLYEDSVGGVFLIFRTAEEIHAAMTKKPAGCIAPGLEVGKTAAQSAANLRTWIRDHIVKIGGIAVPTVNNPASTITDHGFFDEAYHHLTFTQYNEIIQLLNMQVWGAFCINLQQSVGRFYGVTANSEGDGCELLNIHLGPFLG